jgi:hypothetical protein
MRSLPALIFLAATLAACAPRGGAGGAPQARSLEDQIRADSIRLPYTEADLRFMTDMIGHHAQAILISRWVPSHTTDTELHTLAARIINAQTDDITLMQRWLGDRGRPVRRRRGHQEPPRSSCRPRPRRRRFLGVSNSDLAFTGNYAIQGQLQRLQRSGTSPTRPTQAGQVEPSARPRRATSRCTATCSSSRARA